MKIEKDNDKYYEIPLVTRLYIKLIIIFIKNLNNRLYDQEMACSFIIYDTAEETSAEEEGFKIQ